MEPVKLHVKFNLIADAKCEKVVVLHGTSQGLTARVMDLNFSAQLFSNCIYDRPSLAYYEPHNLASFGGR